jgi:hypothetical protein
MLYHGCSLKVIRGYALDGQAMLKMNGLDSDRSADALQSRKNSVYMAAHHSEHRSTSKDTRHAI